MNIYRYFRLDGADDGVWPGSHPLRVGSIVRIDLTAGDRLLMNAWNDDTKAWVRARWVEVPNPASSAVPTGEAAE